VTKFRIQINVLSPKPDMDLEGMHTNIDVCWVRREGKFPAANNALDLSGR